MMHPLRVTSRRLTPPIAPGLLVAACGGLLPEGGATDLSGPWHSEPFAVAAEPIHGEAERRCRRAYDAGGNVITTEPWAVDR
jgi:hypothetical protein